MRAKNFSSGLRNFSVIITITLGLVANVLFSPSHIANASEVIVVGPREVASSYIDRNNAGLTYWPDGFLGLNRSGTSSSYSFFASAGSPTKNLIKTVGTLDNPIVTSVSSITPGSLKSNYDYYAGGPVLRDAGNGTLLMFVHTERWAGGDGTKFWSTIALAKSTDNGHTWSDLGEIISPYLSKDAAASASISVDIGGGSYLIIGNYIYVYFSDLLTPSSGNPIAVARAKLSDVLSAAENQNQVIAWRKYYNGGWTEPGLGGQSSSLEQPITTGIFWYSVSYNQYLNKYLLIGSAGWPNPDLYLFESNDGLSWSKAQQIESDPGMSVYTTIVGTGSDPGITDSNFYIYYVYSDASRTSDLRWNDAILARRQISITSTDIIPPTVSITAPTSGSTVSGSGVPISATASDNVGVAGVQFKLDGNNLGAEDATSPYAATWDSTTVVSGTHTISAIARDAVGNTASSTISVVVSNTSPPPTLILSVSPTSIISGQSSTLTWSSANTTSCAATGVWSGTKATAGSQVISPIVTSSYFLSCLGSGGSVVQSATVTVVPKSVTVTLAGPQEKVFDWSSQRCEDLDIPDAATHAFRDENGLVNLFATVGYRMTGPSLNSATKDCKKVFSSTNDTEQFDSKNNEWFIVPYTLNGKTIYSLIHNEWYAFLVDPRCHPEGHGVSVDGWVSAITTAVSTDRGASYAHPADYKVRQSSVPWSTNFSCQPGNSVRYGAFQFTNIVKKDNYLYSVYRTIADPLGVGISANCLMRTQDLSKGSSWEVLTQNGWDTSLSANCQPLQNIAGNQPPSPPKFAPRSLSYNNYLGAYVLILANNEDGGVLYSLSSDLINWSVPETIPVVSSSPIYYPSLLDPSDTSMNFEFSGQDPYIYYSQTGDSYSINDLDRDLVRQQIHFEKNITPPSPGPPPPPQPPSAIMISNVAVDDITSSGATITFTTNVPTVAQVLYGKYGTYNNSDAPKGPATTHSHRLTRLTSATNYTYKIVVHAGTDSATSQSYAFATAASGSPPPPTSSPPSPPPSLSAKPFTRTLYYGMRSDSDVRRLQEILIAQNLLVPPATGNFFKLTLAAIKAFQAKYNIPTTGVVGPLTRAQLNRLL